MPNYDFECPRGHITEHFLKMDDRDSPVACTFEIEVREISLEQLADSLERDDTAVAQVTEKALLSPAPGEARETEVLATANDASTETPMPDQALGVVTKMPCGIRAKRIISHSDPRALLDHGICANRDAALEGRWDPDVPITRGVRK